MTEGMMHQQTPAKNAWPALKVDDWAPTRDTLDALGSVAYPARCWRVEVGSLVHVAVDNLCPEVP
jgi:hypothetical protein